MNRFKKCLAFALIASSLASAQTAIRSASITNITSPTGTVGTSTYPVASIGNGGTVNAILGSSGWDAMVAGSDIIPSTSVIIETDGIFGIVENQSATTAAVGVRGQAQAAANASANWGGNVLCTDYDHAGTAYTGTKCTGLEIDVNTKSTTTQGAGISLIIGNDIFSTATPSGAFPAINILAKNGSQWSAGTVVNNGSTSLLLAFFAGSQGATGVASKASQYIALESYNAASTARESHIQGTLDGDIAINTQSGRGVCINCGGTVASPVEPITMFANTTSNNQDNTSQGANGSAIEWQVSGAGYSAVFNNSSTAAGSYGFLARAAATTGSNRIFTAASGSNDMLVVTPTDNIFNVGIGPDGSGHKHKRTTACTTGAGANAVCSTTVTWTTPFADANYTPWCTLANPSVAGSAVTHISGAPVAASIAVEITNGPSGGATSGTLDCGADHD